MPLEVVPYFTRNACNIEQKADAASGVKKQTAPLLNEFMR